MNSRKIKNNLMLNAFDVTMEHHILIYNLIMLNYHVSKLFTMCFA